MSALDSRDSFVPRDYSGRVRSLPLRGGQLGRTAPPVQSAFDPCGACTAHFDDWRSPLTHEVLGELIAAPRGLSSSGEAPHPLAALLRRRRGYPRRRTVDCRRFRTTGRHGDDRCGVAHEASRAGDRASWPC
jgi:hypothetical protein